MKPKYGITDLSELMKDRKAFEDFVYTPIDEAINELESRRKDDVLKQRVSELLEGDVPDFLFGEANKAVIFRQISTPNYELRRFVQLVDGHNMTPFFGEYRDDKFTSKNEYKHSWGKMLFYEGHGKRFDSLKVIDLVNSDGKKISEIKTVWGQPLVDFHHELFGSTYFKLNEDYFFDISKWLSKHGKVSTGYYKQIMYWFMYHSLLFENFMFGETQEASFTKDVFLPAFISAFELTGHKPLIINLLPTSLENEKFWLSHPNSSKEYIKSKYPPGLLDMSGPHDML